MSLKGGNTLKRKKSLLAEDSTEGETDTGDMHAGSNLNLLRRGRHFGLIFVQYNGGHGGLTNRNAFHQEHSRVQLRGLRQRPADKRQGETDVRLANWGDLNPKPTCPLTLERRWKKPP